MTGNTEDADPEEVVVEEEQKADEDEDEQQEGCDAVLRLPLSHKSKLALNDIELYTYMFDLLGDMSCPNRCCNSLAILH